MNVKLLTSFARCADWGRTLTDQSSAMPQLPRPQHVILNHLYHKRSKNMWCAGTTHRYRSKYVTVVMYKPERKSDGK